MQLADACDQVQRKVERRRDDSHQGRSGERWWTPSVGQHPEARPAHRRAQQQQVAYCEAVAFPKDAGSNNRCGAYRDRNRGGELPSIWPGAQQDARHQCRRQRQGAVDKGTAMMCRREGESPVGAEREAQAARSCQQEDASEAQAQEAMLHHRRQHHQACHCEPEGSQIPRHERRPQPKLGNQDKANEQSDHADGCGNADRFVALCQSRHSLHRHSCSSDSHCTMFAGF